MEHGGTKFQVHWLISLPIGTEDNVRPFVNPFSALDLRGQPGPAKHGNIDAYRSVARGQIHGVHGTVSTCLCGRKQVSHCIRPLPLAATPMASLFWIKKNNRAIAL